ncbi:MAG: T9SS type A sorting domain-containing protein [Bacteroidetes bacterium]|nr:T9SS type A sorting domain-containing protein [Bacteroidota bacterium]
MKSSKPLKTNTPSQRTNLTTRLSQKQKILIGSVISTMAIVLIVLVYQTFQSTRANAAVNGDYRSKTNGNWSSTSTWESYNGTAWVNASSTPTSIRNEITIRNGHAVTVSANVIVDQVIIEAGGTVNVNSSRTVTINNGTGTDFINNGTINNTGAINLSLGATLSHDANGIYKHTQNGGSITTATWNENATCEVKGTTSTMPSNLGQNFGNFIWNATGQSSNLGFNTNMSIQKDFTILSTGSKYLGLTTNSTSRTMTIGGNINQSGGDFRGTNSSGGGTITVTGNVNLTSSWFTISSGTGACNMTIGGNLNISGGVFWSNEDATNNTLTISGNYTQTDGTFIGTDWTAATTINLAGNLSISGDVGTSYCILTSSSGLCTFNVEGDASITGGNLLLSEDANDGIFNIKKNYTYTGGYVWENSTTNIGQINFNGTSIQQCNVTANTFNNVNYTVKTGATLQMSNETSYLNGDGIFTLEAGAKLGIKSTDGILSSGTTGHIQTATRNFNTGADYEYNGISLQSTGSGLPSSVRNLTINNGSHIILTNSVNADNQLNLLVGNVTTGSNSITVGTSDVSTGTLTRTSGHIIGSLRRWVANAITSGIIFPVGTSTSYNGIIMDFTTAPNGGIISSTFSTGFPGVYGLPITDAGDVCTTIGSGWWTLSGSNGFSDGEYNISTTAEGFTGISDYTKLHLFRRDDDATMWTANGTHVAASGNATTPIANRSIYTSLGQFGITSTSINPLPVELVAFDVTPYNSSAKITWTTASEKNSDFFSVERSRDNKNFEEIQKVTAAGNSSNSRSYEVMDHNPYLGTSYYRLTQTDFDGKQETFDPKIFHNNRTNTGIRNLLASPNPFETDLRLKFETDITGMIPMTITMTNGQLIYNGNLSVKQGKNTISLPLADQLKSGSYFVTIGDGESKISTRIIKK